jgi:HEAT repeats
MTAPEPGKQQESPLGSLTTPQRGAGKATNKPGKWDKLAKGVVVCLGLLLFAWLLWQAPFVREVGVEWLGKIGSPAVPVLRKALQDENHKVRGAAREALRKIGTDAVPPLVQALTDKDLGVRGDAAGRTHQNLPDLPGNWQDGEISL